ncbi:GumC family protein [Aliiruegeria lutimaris]|uniref:GumC family protein n=1 Tax=Aliiruegeria lutimaris TaxID=571298 RepID=UPI0014808FDF|nr:polysaccharide biosynthesis tyrosine autokinase [Aliiruegeria lutimaris]
MNNKVRDNQDQARNRSLPEGYADDDSIDLLAVFRTLWRGKWIIGFCAVLAMLAGGFYAFRMTVPVYSATSVVALIDRAENVSPIEAVVAGFPASGSGMALYTEVEILQSRALGRKLVEKLDLVNDPEFNPPPSDGPRTSLRSLVRSGLMATLGVEEAMPAPPPSDEEILENTITKALSVFSINNRDYSLVFSIRADWTSPDKAALLADTLAQVYIEDQLQQKYDATEQASVWLSDRVVELRADLESSETAAKEFNASIDLVSAETLTAMNRQLKDLRERALATRRETEQAKEKQSALETAVASGSRQAILEAANDPRLERIALDVEQGLARQTTFDTRLAQVQARFVGELSRLEEQASALESSAARMALRVDKQSQDLVTLEQLEREVEANRLIYESFLVRFREISIQEGIQKADARVISPAVVPKVPFAPRKSRIVMMALILGVLVGSGIVLLREMLNRGFRTAKQLEQATGYPVLGQIPVMPIRDRSKLVPHIVKNVTSPAAEATRNLRTSIDLSNVDHPPKVILSTSCVPGEGKTTTAITLAYHYAALNRKVLLLEGDIRRRVMDQYFNLEHNLGFVSVLSGDAELQDVIHSDEKTGFDILPGENTSVSAADLFASEKFRELLMQLRDKYDQVIIDTPPVLLVPDARSIAMLSDVVLVNVKWDSTTGTQLEQGLGAFASVDAKVAGIVLTNVDPKGMRRYGYGKDYGGYGYGRAGYYGSR